MSTTRLILRSLGYYWRTHLAVLFAMIVGTAVLCGALVVGDSVRASLRDMTLDRLGAVDYALSSPNFFEEGLAERLASSPEFSADFDAAAPAILLPASIEAPDRGTFARGVNLAGVDERFWALQPPSKRADDSTIGPAAHPAPEGVWISETVATDLGVAAGEWVLLRLQKPDPIPAEAVHGRRTGGAMAIRIRVDGVLPNRGFGRFGLVPGQQLPRNAFLSLGLLQQRLDQPGQVNSLLVSGAGGDAGQSAERLALLQQKILAAVSLADLGLKLIWNDRDGWLSLESTRMVLRETDSAAALEAARVAGFRAAPTLTYLANTIEIGDRSLPYSTVSALEAAVAPPLGPLFLSEGPAAPSLAAGEILLNQWAADELQARPGDRVRLTYYLSGPTGEFRDDGAAEFTLRGIVAQRGLGAEAGLTPSYPGISDARSLRDWDPPFPIDLSRVEDRDEDYWTQYKALPKAFIPLEDGTRLWTSRFGQYTSVRLAPPEGMDPERAERAFEGALRRFINPEFAGLVFVPVKEQGLRASGGASDFGQLFLGFSFFIIVAAMLLVRLTFVLGVEQRTREIGVLVAVGFSPRQVRRLFVAEGAALAAIGGAVGAALGLGFAALMLHGLRTWWNASVGTTFLYLHVIPSTLAVGALIGAGVGILSVWLAVRRLAGADPLALVSGARGDAIAPRGGDTEKRERRARSREEFLAGAGALVAAACLAGSGRASAAAQAALFYGAGVSVLVASISFLSARLRSGSGGGGFAGRRVPLARLGARNAARNRGRSLLTIGLMSSATFVIVTVGAMRKSGGHDRPERDSGDGGYALLAESDLPLLSDLNTADGRFDLGLQSDTAAALEKIRIFALRLNPGEDASCLNLYRPSQPRVLGAPEDFIRRGGFAFQTALKREGGGEKNPWELLNEATGDDTIPAIADYNTVLWILHSGLGRTIEIRDGAGRPVKLKFVALLKGSALQGEVIVSESSFIELFPERSGSQFFFIEADGPTSQVLPGLLERDLRDYGFDAGPTASRIESYHAVENTYLSTFQALGGLGLLLGTFGLTAVVLRGILERRGELALMACVGYSERALAVVVLAENFLLLVSGLGIGFGAALVATAPTMLQSGASPHLGSLLVTLSALLAAGVVSGIGGVRAISRLPVLESLRSP